MSRRRLLIGSLLALLAVPLALYLAGFRLYRDPLAEKEAAAGSKYPALAELRSLAELRLDRYAETFQHVDPRFKGVVAYGGALAGRKGKAIEQVATANPDFWRAVMEMAPQDPSVGFSQAYLLASRGRLTSAQAWVLVSAPGLDQKAFGPDLEQLRSAVSKAVAEMEPDINTGIALHDQKRFDEAIQVFDAVLASHPENVWALYEKSFSLLMKDKDGSEAAREELYAAIRGLDPFYFEAYQGKVDARRKAQMAALLADILPFIQGKVRDAKGYERFAYGCEAAGLHDYAALAFWKLVTGGDAGASFNHFWLNLSGLGLDGFVERFAGDEVKAEVRKLQGAAASQGTSPRPAARP